MKGNVHEVHFDASSRSFWWKSDLPAQGLPLRVIDVFCGGYGGWVHALRWVDAHFRRLTHVGAFDMDPTMLEMYQKNHGGHICSQWPVNPFSCSAVLT